MTFAWAVRTAPWPIGAVTIGVTEHGLALVAFGEAPQAVRRAEDRLGGPAPAGTLALDVPAAQLDEYFSGARQVFDMPLDWSLTSGSQERVLRALYAEVPFGATVTYGRLAALGGLGESHTAARGVGAIMGSNPVPVVVPCHRVLAADGLGGFGGGRARKEWLLALEGVLPPTLDLWPDAD